MKKTADKTSTPRRYLPWILVMLIFIAELFLYTWCRVQYMRIGYEVSAAAQKAKRLTTLQKDLRIEMARLKSPRRIEQIATRDLGLVRPGPEQMIQVP